MSIELEALWLMCTDPGPSGRERLPVDVPTLTALLEVARAARGYVAWTQGDGEPDVGHSLHKTLADAVARLEGGE